MDECDPIGELGRESRASQCEGSSRRRVERSSLALYWAVCITTTTGSRKGEIHIPELLDGWEFSARTGMPLS